MAFAGERPVEFPELRAMHKKDVNVKINRSSYEQPEIVTYEEEVCH